MVSDGVCRLLRACFFVTAALASGGAITMASAQLSAPGQFGVSPSGAATYSIPIQAPPGVAGVEPKLALEYSSQSGNGLLGVGWSLSGLSSITRCPQTNVQDGPNFVRGVNYSASDRYCLDGQRMLSVSGVYGAGGSEYRTEHDGFSKIVANAEPGATSGPGSFVVKTKSGLTMEYGKTEDSRIEAQGKIDASGHGVVIEWALNKVVDAKGNYYTVVYTEDSKGGQYYPSRMDYTPNLSISPPSSGVNTIFFEYEPSYLTEAKYQAGSKTVNAVRLKVIRIVSGSAAAKTITLAYKANDALHWVGVLSSIQECFGSGGCKPLISIASPTALSGGWVKAPQFILPDYLSGDGVANNGTQLIDLNGDGLTDFVQARWINGATQFRGAWLNTGKGWTSAPQFILPDYLSGDGVANNGTQLIDLNGDGLPDFVQARWINGSTQYRNAWLNTGSGWVSAPQFILPDYLSGDGVANNGTQLIDLNGDGLPDFVQARWINGSTQYRNAWLNTGSGWMSAPQFILPDYLSGDGVANNGTKLIDLNGDGLPDFVQARWINGSTQYRNAWLNNGKGWVSAPQFILPEFLSGDGVANNGTELVDLNGDGLPDFVQARWINGSTQYRNAWLNTGSGWALAPQFILPDYLSGDGVANNGTDLVDLNGDGLPDFVQARWINGSTQYRNAWLNNGAGWVSAPQFILPEYLSGDGVANNGTQAVDLNGDGLPDFVQARWINGSTQYRNVWMNTATAPIVSSVGYGDVAQIAVTYSTAPQLLGTQYVGDYKSKYPIVRVAPTISLVSGASGPDGVGGQRRSAYSYGNFLVEVGLGRGSLGFQWTQTKDMSTGVASRTCYRQAFPYIGMVDKAYTATSDVGLPTCDSITGPSALWAVGSNLLSLSLNSYDFNAFASNDALYTTPLKTVAAGNRYQILTPTSQSQSRDWDSQTNTFRVLPATKTTTKQDNWGNVTEVKTETLNTDGATSSGYSKTTTDTYATPDTTNWRIGRVVRSSVTATAP
jgi:hypothetical protein